MALPLGKTRVTVVEGHLLYAEALEMALVAEGHVVERVTARRAGVRPGEVCAAIVETRPSVVLLDLDIGFGFDAVALLRPLRNEGINVVVVTGSRDEARWGECLWHGARVVLSKSTPLCTILTTMRHPVMNQFVLPSADAARYVGRYLHAQNRAHEVHSRLDQLTPREGEILRALMHGQHVAEIAREKFVAESTVRTQVRSILYKLEVSSQLAAVGVALRAHWHEPASA